MAAAYIDNSGTIDNGEFLVATVHSNKLQRWDNLLSALSFFDKDGSGYITIDELQQPTKNLVREIMRRRKSGKFKIELEYDWNCSPKKGRFSGRKSFFLICKV